MKLKKLTVFAIARGLDTAQGTDGTTIWISFLMNTIGGPNSGIELVRGTNTNIATFGFDTNGTAGFGFADKQGTENDIVVAPQNGTTLFWEARIDYGAGNSDDIELFINGASVGTSSGNDLSFDSLGFLNFSNSPGSTIDETRIGDTRADVSAVPEPSSFLLLALGGLTLVRRKR